MDNRVLVVDDDEGARRFLADALSSRGFQTEAAEDGRSALKKLERSPQSYSLLYTDLTMPGMGGLELIEHASKMDSRIVPVLLSGYADRSNLVAALRAGAYDFICKPYTLSDLDMSLTRSIERRRILLQNEEYRCHLERLVEERNAEIAGTNRTLMELYSLGQQSYAIIDLEPQMNDFSKYATEHFHPDTFGVFVLDDGAYKALVLTDRFSRPVDPAVLARMSGSADFWNTINGELPHLFHLQRHNRRAYCFPFPGEVFQGFIYVGYDGDRVQLIDNQRHIFGLFRDRIRAYLKEHYTAQRHQKQMKQLFVSSIQAHARSIEAKDVYTAGHCDRVDRFAEIIARKAGRFDERWIFNVKVGSILHDIGKIGVRGEILCKPGTLTEDERNEIEAHPAIGGRIVRALHGLQLEPIVRHHHERFDGRGYPDKLKGDQIPLESRLILVADTWDAMTSDRTYRKALSLEKSMDELKKCSGLQFDPEIVDLALDSADELEAARIEMSQKPQGEYFKVAD